MSSPPWIEPGRPMLIVQTGNTLAALRRHGDFPDWIRHGLGLRRDAIEVVRVHEGGVLPDPRTVSGALVTGSGAMVTDRLDWSEDTAAWLREAVAAGLPLLGICYGHQLLAHALGGNVASHPCGREVGTVEVERLPTADSDALFDAAPKYFRAHATHEQSVQALPPGAVALARSAHDAHQAVRFAANAWGVQFHPEFSAAVMQAYVKRPSTVNCTSPCCACQAARPAPFGRRLLRRFRDLACMAG